MAFTKALYYPRIEVPNEGWLKAAALYWDEKKQSSPPQCPILIPVQFQGNSSMLGSFPRCTLTLTWMSSRN